MVTISFALKQVSSIGPLQLPSMSITIYVYNIKTHTRGQSMIARAAWNKDGSLFIQIKVHYSQTSSLTVERKNNRD